MVGRVLDNQVKMEGELTLFGVLKRTYGLVTQGEKSQLVLLLGGIFLGSLFEILGLAVVIPVISIVVNPKLVESNYWLSCFYDFSSQLGVKSMDDFVLLLCFFLVSAFIFKALMGLSLTYFQSKFSFRIAHRLSSELWDFHFSKSLVQVRSLSTGTILADINNRPVFFAQVFVLGGLVVVSEFIIVLMIIAGLMIYNSIVFLSVAGILVTGALIIRFTTRKQLEQFSALLNALEPKVYTLLSDSIRGIIELIAFQATSTVQRIYSKELRKIFNIHAIRTALNSLPARLYELLAVLGIAVAIVVFTLYGEQQNKFLELLTVVAVSAYRVMPSMSRVNGALMQMKAQNHVLVTMEQAQNSQGNQPSQSDPDSSPSTLMTSPPAIELRNVSFGYNDTQVISNLSHTFQPGRIHAIVGKSGSGKSTLIHILLGLQNVQKGQVVLRDDFGEKILGRDILSSAWLVNIGYLNQSPFLFEGTLFENLTLRSPDIEIDEQHIETLIADLDLVACFTPEGLDFRLSEGGANLSGGQQQRTAFVRALSKPKPIYILDEATSALDVDLRDTAFDLIRQKADAGATVIIVTHDIELSAKCDSILELQNLTS